MRERFGYMPCIKTRGVAGSHPDKFLPHFCSMVRVRWTTDEQLLFLWGQRDRYLAAKSKRTTTTLYSSVLQEWVDKWEVESPTAADVQQCGSEEKAKQHVLTLLSNVSNSVSLNQPVEFADSFLIAHQAVVC